MESINLTNTLAGLAAIQRAMAGEDILFTKLEIGDGVLTDTDVSKMTRLINKTKDYVLGAVDAEDSEIVRLRSNLSNDGVTQDLIIREYGIYAKFGEEQEFLFAYLNTGNVTTPLPSERIGRYELNRDFVLYIGTSLNVDFTSNGNLVYATLMDLKKEEIIDEIKRTKKYKINDVVDIFGYMEKTDGMGQKVVIQEQNDGSGIKTLNELYANLLPQNGVYNIYGNIEQQFLDKEKRYGDIIKFNNPTDINIENKLSINRKNYLLKGQTNNIKTTELSNLHVAYVGDDKGKKFSGKINSGFIKKVRALNSLDKPLKIMILGDSISQGKDWGEGIITQLTAGINNKNHNSNWAEIFAQRLLGEINAPTIIYNRSIPGRGYGDLQTPLKNLGNNLFSGQDFVNQEHTWYNNVMACNPDVIILSMGMNHSDDTHYNLFIANFYNHIKEDVRFKNKLIQFAVLTTPNPKFDFHEQSDFSHYSANATKIIIQQQQRSIAKKLSGYVIDSGRASSIFRYGFDPCNYTISNRDILIGATNLQTQKEWEKGVLINDLKNATLKLKLKNTPIGYALKFACNFNDDFLNTPAATFRYEPFETNTKTVVQFVSNGNGTISVRIFDTVGGNSTNTVLLNNTKSLTIQIEVLPNYINVYVDNNLLCQQRNPVFYKPYNAFTTNGGTVDIVLQSMLEWQPARYEQCLLETEMWSINSAESEYGQNSEDGYGGGVNHPSTLGVSNVYNLTILEFIEDFIKIYNKKENFIKINGALNKWQKIGIMSTETFDNTPAGYIRNIVTCDSFNIIVPNGVINNAVIRTDSTLNEFFKIGLIKFDNVIEIYINITKSYSSLAYELGGDISTCDYLLLDTEPSNIFYPEYGYKNVTFKKNDQIIMRNGNGKNICGQIETTSTENIEIFNITFVENFVTPPIVLASSGINSTSDEQDNIAEDKLNVSKATTTGVKITLIKKGSLATIPRLIQFNAIGI